MTVGGECVKRSYLELLDMISIMPSACMLILQNIL